MKSLADKIEEYIKVLIERSESKTLELQRTELAETFNCVPSQITYVLATRFTPEEGFVIESRRGGKGYVRIRRIKGSGLVKKIRYSQAEACDWVDDLIQQGLLNGREARLIGALIDNQVLGQLGEQADVIRARMLEAIIQWLRSEN